MSHYSCKICGYYYSDCICEVPKQSNCDFSMSDDLSKKYAKAFEEIAKGKQAQVKNTNWESVSTEGLIRRILNGIDPTHIRFTDGRRMVKVVIPGSVTKPVNGEIYYTFEILATGTKNQQIIYDSDNSECLFLRNTGRLYSSSSDSMEVADKICKQLRDGEKYYG